LEAERVDRLARRRPLRANTQTWVFEPRLRFMCAPQKNARLKKTAEAAFALN
jgi:hypothetical protein